MVSVTDFACSKINGMNPPRHVQPATPPDKATLIGWMQTSMEFCKQAFSTLDDANIKEPVPWDGNAGTPPGSVGTKVTRFAAASWVTDTLIERYGASSGYMHTGISLSTVVSVPWAEKGHPPAVGPQPSPPSQTPSPK